MIAPTMSNKTARKTGIGTLRQIAIYRAVAMTTVGAGLDLPFEKIRPRWTDFFAISFDLHEFHPIEV